MRICLAQTRPVKGDIQRNIEKHKAFVELAIAHRANLVIFPELSITGYEPTLAHELATTKDDVRFDEFQKISDAKHISIGIGVPTRNDSGIFISMVIFQPHKTRETYSKKYIHADEDPFFVSGQGSVSSIGRKGEIALAICYEVLVPRHSEEAFRSGARIYLASVAKTAHGVANAANKLSGIARNFSMTVLMCNCVGPCDNFQAAGKSAVWNDKGELIAQLDEASEGMLLFDSDTREAIEILSVITSAAPGYGSALYWF
ncbi:MAG: carbon-nitrogen hydrolase family protein [Bryobacterales bacterium]|nr:carbon-nitrogen hydrolase family protein [Bryobacterales bacterium]MBV9398896.1 carbon-nitrogen hydrolase family protein [Bryobacterales bacterium]